jgi:hypothetical protein
MDGGSRGGSISRSERKGLSIDRREQWLQRDIPTITGLSRPKARSFLILADFLVPSQKFARITAQRHSMDRARSSEMRIPRFF